MSVHMCLLFSIRHSSCSEGVVCYQSNHEWLKTKRVWYFIQYVTLKHNHIEYHSFKYWCIFYLFYGYLHSNIKSHQSYQTRSTTLRNFICCQYFYFLLLLAFYDLEYMYMYNLCCIRTLYANYSNSTTI